MGLSDLMDPNAMRGPEPADPNGFTPTQIVSPMDVDMDLNTMRFAPGEYLNMAMDGVKNMFGSDKPERGAPTTHPFAGLHEELMHPDSKGIIEGVDKGYADKKYMKVAEDIRNAIKIGDTEAIQKGHAKFAELLQGPDVNPLATLADMYLGLGYNTQKRQHAHKVASDFVMNELIRPGSTAGPMAEEAVRMGIIQPHELRPDQVQPGRMVPSQGFPFYQMTNEMGSPDFTPQGAALEAIPGVQLSPYQEQMATARQHAISTGATYRAQAAQAKSVLDEERAITEREKRKEMPVKVKALQALTSLRNMQGDLARARVDWYKQLPALRRELQGGTSPFELEGLKRVHAAISNHKLIDPADWAIWQRWLTKAQPQFGMDFMGNAYNKQTGKSSKGGTAIEMMGIATPPDTSLEPHEQAEAEAGQSDVLHQLGQMLGSLLQGGDEKKPETFADTKKSKAASKPEAKTPVMTPAEKAELDALRKKHGR